MVSLIKKLFASEKAKQFGCFLLDKSEWFVFLKRLSALSIFSVIAFAIWIMVAGPVAFFYSDVHKDFINISKEKDYHGINTINSVVYSLQDMLDKGLVTNFIGVRWWIDNRPNEEIGKIRIFRIISEGLENNLARNRGTGPVNSDIANARARLFIDYESPFLPSYTTMVKQAIKFYKKFTEDLMADYNLPINQRKALFIPDAVNLSAVIDKVKKEIQTTISVEATNNFFQEDDEYYLIRGKLVATYLFMSGVGDDFKEKLKDKEAYDETYLPLMDLLKKTIDRKTFFVITHYATNDLAYIRGNAQLVANMMTELRNKLNNG